MLIRVSQVLAMCKPVAHQSRFENAINHRIFDNSRGYCVGPQRHLRQALLCVPRAPGRGVGLSAPGPVVGRRAPRAASLGNEWPRLALRKRRLRSPVFGDARPLAWKSHCIITRVTHAIERLIDTPSSQWLPARRRSLRARPPSTQGGCGPIQVPNQQAGRPLGCTEACGSCGSAYPAVAADGGTRSATRTGVLGRWSLCGPQAFWN